MVEVNVSVPLNEDEKTLNAVTVDETVIAVDFIATATTEKVTVTKIVLRGAKVAFIGNSLTTYDDASSGQEQYNYSNSFPQNVNYLICWPLVPFINTVMSGVIWYYTVED